MKLEMARKLLIEICCDITRPENTEIETITKATRDCYCQRINDAARQLDNHTFEFDDGYYFQKKPQKNPKKKPQKNPFEKQSIANMKMNIGKWLNGENRPSRKALLEFAIVLGMEKDRINSLLEAYGHMRIVLRNPLDAFVYYNISNQKGLASFIKLQKQYCDEKEKFHPKEEKRILNNSLLVFKGLDGLDKDASVESKLSYLKALWGCGEREQNWIKSQLENNPVESNHLFMLRVMVYLMNKSGKEWKEDMIQNKLSDLRRNMKDAHPEFWKDFIAHINELSWEEIQIYAQKKKKYFSKVNNQCTEEIEQYIGEVLNAIYCENIRRNQRFKLLLEELKKRKEDKGYSTRIQKFVDSEPKADEEEFFNYLLKYESELRCFSESSRRTFSFWMHAILSNRMANNASFPQTILIDSLKGMFTVSGMFCAYAEENKAFKALHTWSRNHEKTVSQEYVDAIIESIYPAPQCNEIKAMLTLDGIRKICEGITLTDEQWDDILKKTHDAVLELMHRHWIDPSTIIDGYIRPIIEGKREISRTALLLMALYADAKGEEPVSVESVLASAKYAPVEYSAADWIACHLQKSSQALPEVSNDVLDKLFFEQLENLKKYKEMENSPEKYTRFKEIMQALVGKMKEYDIICFKNAISHYAAKLAMSKSKTLPWRVFPIINPFVTMEFVHDTNSMGI